MNTKTLAERISGIKRELADLGPMRPGSLSEQYNVCGTTGCRCKDPKKPEKHGPYYHLNYTWRGKARTEFVKADAVAALREQLTTYKRFRALCDEWVEISLELARLHRADH
ncbi:MAG: DUF6788 family protein [Planctomycetota bacterium]